MAQTLLKEEKKPLVRKKEGEELMRFFGTPGEGARGGELGGCGRNMKSKVTEPRGEKTNTTQLHKTTRCLFKKAGIF